MEEVNGTKIPKMPTINYPPLFVESDLLFGQASWEREPGETKILGLRISRKNLFFAEWYLTNLASVMFVVGSFLFNPENDRETLRWAAILFIVGSAFFLVSTGIIFIRNNCNTFEDMGTSLNCILYMLANSLFVIGSVFFLPKLEDNESFLISGLCFFIVGSLLFFCAPFYSVYRLYVSEVEIPREYFVAEVTVACFFCAGNAMFIVGSVFFLPAVNLNNPALQLFIFGSFAFLLATFILTIKQGLEEFYVILSPGEWSRWLSNAESVRTKGHGTIKSRATGHSQGESTIDKAEKDSVQLSVVSSPAPRWKEASLTTPATESPLFNDGSEHVEGLATDPEIGEDEEENDVSEESETFMSRESSRQSSPIESLT